MSKGTDRDICELINSCLQSITTVLNNINNNLFRVKIITQPVAYINAVLGDTVQISVVAANAISYQWYRKAVLDTTWSKVSGATNSVLSFTADTTGNNSYRCEITGKDGFSTVSQSCLVQITSE